MPVADYGVVIGEYDHFDRDDANHYGSYYHGHVFVRVGGAESPTLYNCAVDVKYPDGAVQYFIPSKLDETKFDGLDTRADGFYSLAPTSTSGAIDYVRDPFVSEPLGCLAIFVTLWNALTGQHNQVWKENVGYSALNDLVAFLAADGGISRIWVFGARYQNAAQDPPQGMHDCHMNQGDPPGQYQVLDGIWQDGGIVVRRPSGILTGFFVKFVTQTLNTDDHGLPR
jgi:hypothetical protein